MFINFGTFIDEALGLEFWGTCSVANDDLFSSIIWRGLNRSWIINNFHYLQNLIETRIIKQKNYIYHWKSFKFTSTKTIAIRTPFGTINKTQFYFIFILISCLIGKSKFIANKRGKRKNRRKQRKSIRITRYWKLLTRECAREARRHYGLQLLTRAFSFYRDWWQADDAIDGYNEKFRYGNVQWCNV